MNEEKDFQQDIASIRNLMERSTKFISLSGLSGILAGTYALAGAAAVYYIAPELATGMIPEGDVLQQLALVAVVVLGASLTTGFWLTARNARKAHLGIWSSTSRRLAVNLAIPLLTGGLLILIQTYYQHYETIAPSFLIFYGLALLNASPNLYEEIRYLGYLEIVLGLLCAAFPHHGLYFWAIGFGICHIIYGAIMFRNYELTPNSSSTEKD